MFAVTVLAVGKLKEKFYLDASREYLKRLSAYCVPTLLELPEQRLPENPSQAELDAALSREADSIRAKLPKGAFVCVMTPEGQQMSSEELADGLRRIKNSGKSSLAVVIGGSFGLSEALKAEAHFRLSMSKMTFPHHLARVMVLEQLYRAETIQAGTRYHK